MRRTPDQERELLGLGVPPAWADRWGQDRYGVFASFVVDGVAQRMRWIRAGGFVMGSPADEPGRWENEGPQHRVTLTKGFWMADAPCTQALWQVVMGDNPSEFKSPRRPVEQVSWNDVQEFLDRLNRQRSGLNVGLPTEAQWEYACRAGTTTATYSGPIEILGENHAPILDEIAWYGGNSGVRWDLDPEQGYDSSKWIEKQHSHSRAGTREVGLKRPNPWGLHDMLGNVWEWCTDYWGDYVGEDAVDPPGPPSGARRVSRGGSWLRDARAVRAAFRGAYGPGFRNVSLGFRLVRGQGLRQAGERSESKPQIAKRRDGKASEGDPSGGRPAPPQIEVESCVILRINVGEPGSNFITEQESRSIVDHPNPICVSYEFDRRFDRRTITTRQWRTIARGLDRLVEQAERARNGATHFVIVARAPLPVFAYLGARMYRYGKVSVANFFDGTWQLYGPHFAPASPGRDDFTCRPPKVGGEPTGKLALALRSSSEHVAHVDSLVRMAEAEGGRLAGCYEIANTKTSQFEFAPTNAELPVILDHVRDALAWRSREAPKTDGMIFALACPNWLAFYVTHTINPNVVGRMDLDRPTHDADIRVDVAPALGHRHALIGGQDHT